MSGGVDAGARRGHNATTVCISAPRRRSVIMIRIIAPGRPCRPAAGRGRLLLGCGPKGADDRDAGTNAVDCSWTGRRAAGGAGPRQPPGRLRAAPNWPRTSATWTPGRAGVLDKLVAAAKHHERALRRPGHALPRRAGRPHATSCRPIARDDARRYFAINVGPWDRRFDREPFFGDWPHPEGANFYPLDLTDSRKGDHRRPAPTAWTACSPWSAATTGGSLEAIPYSECSSSPGWSRPPPCCARRPP